jgi:ATP adenylyltransferase
MDSLWAPWRIGYIKGIDKPKEEGCFLCNAGKSDELKKNLVLAKEDNAFVIMNRFPYNPGHLMVVCNEHVGYIDEVAEGVEVEMWRLMVICKKALGKVMNAHGYNIGINQGRCAGAGVTDHLHIHVVPRWDGDNNFMSVTSDTRILSQALDELYDDLIVEINKLL